MQVCNAATSAAGTWHTDGLTEDMTVNISSLLNLPALRQMFGGFAQSRTVEKLAFPASRHSVLWTNTYLNRAIGTAYVPAAGTGDGSPD